MPYELFSMLGGPPRLNGIELDGSGGHVIWKECLL
jgi:hypothetical protein